MTTLDVTYWMRLLGMVAGEAACVVGLIFLADRLVKSGFWRRSLWRMGMACLMVVIASELTGFGRGMAVWTRRAAKVAPAARAQVSVDYVALPPGSVSAGQAAMPPVMAVPSVEKVKATKTLWLPGLIWLAGFVLVVGRMAAAQIFMGVLQWRRTALQGTGLNRRVTALLGQMGSKLRVRLLETPGLVCPAAFGIVRPTIALPDGFEKWFTPAQQDVMLAHELAHLAARDPLW